MSESEFDKQVQQEMQGLRLRPSAAVWENVEKELRRKKRRRVIVFFWLLAGLGLLGYTGFLLIHNDKPALAKSSAPATPGSSSVAAPGHPGAGQEPTAGSGNDEILDSKDRTPQQTQTILNSQDTISTANSPAVDQNIDQKIVKGGKAAAGPAITGSRKNKTNRKTSLAGSSPARTAKEKLSPDNEITAVDAKTNESILPQQPATGTVDSPDSGLIAKEDSLKPAADTVLASADPLPEKATPVVKKKSSSKIKWALDLSVGISGPTGRAFLLGNKAETPMMDASFGVPNSPVVTPGNQGGGSFGPIYIPRSDITPGPAFRIGVLGEWAISKRSSISTGLQYQYQSNNIRIGHYLDTSLVFSNFASQQIAVRAVYQGPQKKTFTNRFHYFQIPVLFQWQMNPGRKLPLVLNAGLSAGYLFSTNGLVYDSLQGGIYYHDKNAFNRFQFSLTTGLSFRFGDKRAFQWSVGPEFSMGLRRSVKELYDKKQYPLYGGIGVKLYWPGKKKK